MRSHAARSSTARLADSASVFEALSDRTRLRIVTRLSETGHVSTSELTQGTGVSRQAVTKHLGRLAKAGLVRSERQGRERLWDLRTEPLARAGRDLEAISKRWDEALARLRKMVE
jgi:DNA-binding transcriptional ArsR family regulator